MNAALVPLQILSVAEAMQLEIHTLLKEATLVECSLEARWVRLGQLLAKFQEDERWRQLGYTSFEQFILELRDTYHRRRTQLWSYLSVAKQLLPVVGESTLQEIGISKAVVLKRVVKAGKELPPEMVEKAKQQATTIKELRGMVGQLLYATPEEKGSWFDLNGFFLSDDEKKEFKDAVRMTKTLLNIANDVPDHVQRKMIFTAWMMEFTGTHMAEVYGPKSE